MTTKRLRAHDRLAVSRANGACRRAVIWLQGCPIRCRDRFNRQTFHAEGGEPVTADALFDWLAAIDGVSVSGGEPSEQIPPLNHHAGPPPMGNHSDAQGHVTATGVGWQAPDGIF